MERVPTIRSSGPQFLAAWTLIEMIAALAVLAILAALLLPAFIEMDKTTADQEGRPCSRLPTTSSSTY